MQERISQWFSRLLPPDLDYCSLRWVNRASEQIVVKKDVLQPLQRWDDRGVMLCVMHQGGLGYAATADVSESGISRAMEQAREWASISSARAVFDFSKVQMPGLVGEHFSQVKTPWESVPLKERIDALRSEVRQLKNDDRVVEWGGFFNTVSTETMLLTSHGGSIHQQRDTVYPNLWVTGYENAEAQTRSLAGGGLALQGGWEHVEQQFIGQAGKLAQELSQLLAADNCPEQACELLLMPDQMILQIHESIGHPLELDRILGDERNYAGTTFVTPDMVGSFQYGSELLNVSFDPTIPHEFVSYGFDDDGAAAKKQLLIENGILKRVLGGTVSQARAGLPGVSNSRAQSWNRPPLDRMANLNIEPGVSTLEDMIGSVEQGVLMSANRSWSIDDSRNKFQFGCEWGQLIENGELTRVVKNPNYRGVSRDFWRGLSAVGNQDSLGVHGTPNCGKAEPNQVVDVGHASPACLFQNVEVFGG